MNETEIGEIEMELCEYRALDMRIINAIGSHGWAVHFEDDEKDHNKQLVPLRRTNHGVVSCDGEFLSDDFYRADFPPDNVEEYMLDFVPEFSKFEEWCGLLIEYLLSAYRISFKRLCTGAVIIYWHGGGIAKPEQVVPCANNSTTYTLALAAVIAIEAAHADDPEGAHKWTPDCTIEFVPGFADEDTYLAQ